jgi:hypothetical protein
VAIQATRGMAAEMIIGAAIRPGLVRRHLAGRFPGVGAEGDDVLECVLDKWVGPFQSGAPVHRHKAPPSGNGQRGEMRTSAVLRGKGKGAEVGLWRPAGGL